MKARVSNDRGVAERVCLEWIAKVETMEKAISEMAEYVDPHHHGMEDRGWIREELERIVEAQS